MIPQSPWTSRSFRFDFPPGMLPVIISRLEGTLPRIRELIKSLTEEQLTRNEGNSWSIKEQLGHLHDLEDLWLGRLDDFDAGLAELRPADMSNQKTREANYNSWKLETILNEFESKRQQLVQRSRELDEAKATRTALHPRLKQPMRLMDSLFFVAEHDDHHLARITALIKS